MQASSSGRLDQQPNGCGGELLLATGGVWALFVTFFGQVAVWFGDQFAGATGGSSGGVGAVIAALVVVGLAGLPLAALLPLARSGRPRIVVRAWLLASLLAATFAPLRALPALWSQPLLLGQAFVALALAAVLALVLRRQANLPRGTPLAALLPAIAVGLLAALPWLWRGALGSPLDTLLACVAGLAFGLLAGLLLDGALFGPLAAHPLPPRAELIANGFAATVALAILAGGFGASGLQGPLALALPALGLAAAAMPRFAAGGRAWLPLAATLGLAAAPLALVDADEINLIIGLGDIPAVAFQAALLTTLAGLAVGLALLALAPAIRRTAPTAALGLVGVAAAAVLTYTFPGQPGFYGERLFVILRDQADLGAAAQQPDRPTRLRFVYQTLTAHADQTQTPLRELLTQRGLPFTPYYLVNAIEVHAGDPWLRAELAARPEVDRVLDSPRLRPLPYPTPTERGSEPAPDGVAWSVEWIGANRVWDELGVTGEGIVVGQSDSGAEGSHPALEPGYRGANSEDDYHWLDPWSGTDSPTDHGGHGTHTLGTILGRGGIGVAPGAEWIGCVNLERNLANPALYLDCMQFMLAPHPQNGDPLRDGDPARAAHVLNNSWGCPPEEGCDANVYAPAVEALRAAGIFVVVSAGNDGPGCSSLNSPPATYDAVFSVGAVDASGDLADFSSRGPVTMDGSNRVKPDLVAPGVDVLSAYPGGSYASTSGTSMAGPHVVGVVALMWSANPRLVGDIERTEQILIKTATPYAGVENGCFDTGTPSSAYGYGVLDAYSAVREAIAARP